MKKLTIVFGVASTFVAVFAGFFSSVASADSYNNNRIIDDAVFSNTGTMTASQIDSFLNQFPNSCISPASGFAAVDPTGYSPSTGYTYGGHVTAGKVIYDAAQAYNINPQVLLATLQKEQSLVIGGANFCENGDLNKYAAAVGYGCPDSGTSYNYSGLDLYQRNGATVSNVGPTCVNSASKAGFSQQVIRAAWLLKFGQQRSEGNTSWAIVKPGWDNSDDKQTCYGGPMTQGTWARCPGGGTTYYDGYTTIDGTAVHMDNGSTAALYWYTPHFHGNQSFFNVFTSWFGSTQFPFSLVQPQGSYAIYITFDGMKQLISDLPTLNAWGFNKYPVQTIDQATFNAIPTYTGPLTRYVNSGATNYYIDNGTAYSVSNQLFNQWGQFNGQGIAAVYSKVLGLVTDAGPLTELVQSSGSGTIYLMDGGHLRPFNDYTTFTEWQPNANVVTISNSMFSEYGTDSAVGTPLVTANGKEYLISNGTAYVLGSGQRQALPASWSEIAVSAATVASRNNQNLQYVIGASGDPALYLLDGGQKRPFSSYDLYMRYSSGAHPSQLNQPIMSALTAGSTVDRSIFSYNGTNGILDASGKLLCFDSNSANSYATDTKTLSLNAAPTLNYLLSRGCSGIASQYVKIDSQPAIYALSAGTKLPIANLNTLFSFAPNVNVTNISSSDGALFSGSTVLSKFATDGTTNYFVDGGQKYTVTSTAAANWKLSAPVTLGAGLLTSLPTNTTALSNHIDIGGMDYLIDTGSYFRSPSYDVRMIWGLNNNLVSLTNRSLDTLTSNGDLTRLVAASDSASHYAGTIYGIDGGSLLLLTSLDQLKNLRFAGNPVKLSDVALGALGAANPPTLHPYLIKDANGTAYVVNGGSRQAISSSLSANWLGSQSPTTVSTYFMTGLASGGTVTGSISANSNPTIYYLNNGSKVGFTSYNAYSSSSYAPATQISPELMSLIP